MSNRLVTHHDDAVFTIASVGNMILLTVSGRAKLLHVEGIRHAVASMRVEHPRIAAMAVVRSASAEMTPEVRDALTAVMRDMESVSAGSAVVLEGDGVLKGVIRAAMAGLMILARAKFPYKTFASLPDATDWALEYMVPRPTPAERSAVRRDILDHFSEGPARKAVGPSLASGGAAR